jgi:lipopolysaccharide assembly protein A
MRIFFYVLIILTVLLGIVFAALNATPVMFHYYVGTKELPLSFLLAFSFTVGVVLGWFSSLMMVLRAKRKIFEVKHQMKKLKEQNNPR